MRDLKTCLSTDLFSHYDEGEKLVIIVDILRATSVISTAFHYGISKLIPVDSVKEAEKYLNKAITINPNNPYAHNNLASVLIRLGRNEESINYSQKAVKINNNFSLAYNNLGLAQKNIKKNEDSKISFLKKKKKQMSYHIIISQIYMRN